MNKFFPQQQLLISLLILGVAKAQNPVVESALQELSSDLEHWKREVRSKFQETEKRAEAAEMKALNLERMLEAIRVPPIGFIYIQYGNQASPSSLWPAGRWADVSSSYAGRFFRAVGGEAGGFGENQEDWCPRIHEFGFRDSEYLSEMKDSLYPAYDKGYSAHMNPVIKSGGYSGSWTGLRIYSKGGEVRPKNQAVRLWQRTA